MFTMLEIVGFFMRGTPSENDDGFTSKSVGKSNDNMKERVRVRRWQIEG